MDIILQIETFFYSFIFGFIFFYITFFHFKLTKKKSKLVRFVLDFIYVMDIVFVYLIILYKINLGIFHIYFFFIIVLGYYIGFICKKNVKVLKEHCKHKK